MFTSYTLKREAFLNSTHVKITLYVDCEHKEGEVRIAINRKLMPVDYAQPRWWEIDTPAKAEAWFRKIDMDSLAYQFAEAA